jgi:uncharacterized RDD family membrane protein YckC
MQNNGLTPGSSQGSEQRDLLREEYTIDTPENVTFGYSIAGIGSRFIGALVDTSLLALALILLNIAISLLLVWLGDNAPAVESDVDLSPDWVAGILIAIYALINFGLIWGYFLAFELTWNGQTPGKRLAGTQVVQVSGAPAGFGEIAIRNVIRIVDFLPFAYAIGFVVMFSNRRARRLGDFAANTLVIRRQERVKLSDLAAAAPAALPPSTPKLPDDVFARFPNLTKVTADDYQLIRDVLARHAQGTADNSLLRRLAAAMAARVGAHPPDRDQYSCRLFLEGLADAYRAVQSQGESTHPDG